jgi:hypothetical protein
MHQSTAGLLTAQRSLFPMQYTVLPVLAHGLCALFLGRGKRALQCVQAFNPVFLNCTFQCGNGV